MTEVAEAVALRATRIGGLAFDHLGAGIAGRVLALFQKSFYVETPRGLACIGHQGMPAGPLNVSTSAPATTNWRASGLRLGARVARVDTRLRIAPDLTVDLEGAGIWQPPAPPPAGVGSVETLAAYRNRLVPDPRMGRELTAWLAAVAQGEAGLADRVAAALVGRGPGLTPAGDDVLAGALVALHTLGRRDLAGHLWPSVRRRSLRAGNPISTAHLAAAARGQATAVIHLAIARIIAGEVHDLETMAAGIAAIGHSSGRDAMAGVLAVLSQISTKSEQ